MSVRRLSFPFTSVRCAVATLLAGTVFGLTACGGGSPVASAASTQAAAQAVEALFDERGQPRLSPGSLVPADTAARSRSGLYATRAQLDWEMLLASPVTVLLDVDLLGSTQAAVLLAEQVRGLRDTRGLAFFVKARHAPDAARVADTLADAGFAPVFVVVERGTGATTMDWLFKAGLTASLVALLLVVVPLWGQRVAGLVVGMPTVSGPALAWLALARGPVFAGEAAAGAIAAGGLCALFSLGYALASRRAGPAAALVAGTLSAAAPLGLLAHWRPPTASLVLLALIACTACSVVLRARSGVVSSVRGEARTRLASSQVGLTALVSGAVSGIVTAFAGELGAFASGVVAGAPLIAAAVVVRLHLAGGSFAVAPFVRGYLGGLIGRTCFVAVFAVLCAGA